MWQKFKEWDDKRKFGHTFTDFVILFLIHMVISLISVFCLQCVGRLAIVVISSFICIGLSNRQSPDR